MPIKNTSTTPHHFLMKGDWDLQINWLPSFDLSSLHFVSFSKYTLQCTALCTFLLLSVSLVNSCTVQLNVYFTVQLNVYYI